MDLELDAVPEAPAPRNKTYVRERYKALGWGTPPGNLVAIYLEACERHKVPSNSAVIAQLQRRVRLMQSGPWQRVCPATEPPTASASLPPRDPSPSASTRFLSPSSSQPQPYPQPSQSLPQLQPTNSHAALAAAAQTCAELRDLIQAHVYPLTLGSPALRPGTAGGTVSASELHAATLSSAALALAAGGAEGELYAASAVAHVCQLVDPRTPWDEQLVAAGLPPGCRVLTEAQFQGLLEAAASAAACVGELRQAAMEVLQRPVGHNTLDVEGMLGALFDYMDVTAQGSLPASELRAAVAAFCPAAAADLGALAERLPQLARQPHEQVSREDFVSVLASLSPWLAPPGSSPGLVRDKAEIAVNAMLENKIREPYGYDFSRCYLGPRGLLPVLDALGRDSAFCALSLAHCGLGCSSVERLVDWLRGHPCLTSLDLTHNLIGDRGGLALTQLLQENRGIVELGIGSTYLLPPRPSRTHHDTLGPSPCEDARPVLAALAANRADRRSSPAEIVRVLRQHGPELRAMCYSLLAREDSRSSSRSPSPGGRSVPRVARVPLESLRQALGEVVAEWGFTPDALDEVLQHERLLGTATAGRTADASGRLGVTYEELMHFLRSEDQILRVARAFRNHLVPAKQLFYSLAPEQVPSPSASAYNLPAIPTIPTFPSSTAAMGSGLGAMGAGGSALNNSYTNSNISFNGSGNGVATGAGAVVSGPRTALSTVRQGILAAASQPGSGWDVSEADLEAVLSVGFMRAHMGAAAAGGALRNTSGGLGAAGGGGGGGGGYGLGAGAGNGASAAHGSVVGPDGLLVPEWALGSAAAGWAGGNAGSGASPPPPASPSPSASASVLLSSCGSLPAAASLPPVPPVPSDMLISWPDLCNTLLYLFNR